MTPLDEAPEQRWRRTVDRRNRPAKLKVDRLLRDFGYAELDDEVGDAIEARLAGVALAVAPSLRDASANEVVTIYANDSAAPREEPTAPREPAADAPLAPEPAAATDVAQMVTYLKQQVLDARAEAERLRTELDRRIASREDSESEAQAIIADQAAALQEQHRQIAELGAALDQTRQALAETRDEIRRAVGELQALPELPPLPERVAEDEPPEEYALSGEELADEFSLSGEAPADEVSLSGEESGDGREEAAAAGWVPAALRPEPPAARSFDIDLDEPPLGAKAPERAAEPEFELDVPPLGTTPPGREPEPASPQFDLDEPPLGAKPPEPTPDADADVEQFELDEPPLGAAEHGPAAEASALASRQSEWLPDGLAPPRAAATGNAAGSHGEFERLPAADSAAPANGAGDSAADDDLLSGFDDFLYDDADLYDPARGEESLDEAPSGAPGLDPHTTALPPPPPPPPSPFESEPAAPAERATIGKVLRGRGGRGGRGRWAGNCSVCGRMPVENRRRDLEAAGWDLDDEAPACPQCRGLG